MSAEGFLLRLVLSFALFCVLILAIFGFSILFDIAINIFKRKGKS